MFKFIRAELIDRATCAVSECVTGVTGLAGNREDGFGEIYLHFRLEETKAKLYGLVADSN